MSGLHACYNVGSSVFSPIGAPIPRGTGNHPNAHLVGIGDCNGPHEPGISTSADYVPALCTHRPSLLPMDYLVRSLEAYLVVPS
uniref:Uncharacterized protein n=1 Tax=Anopheles stephensi TaxID=30069 RepID=A0A182YTD3_ANOST